jgi:hypothetical protein
MSKWDRPLTWEEWEGSVRSRQALYDALHRAESEKTPSGWFRFQQLGPNVYRLVAKDGSWLAYDFSGGLDPDRKVVDRNMAFAYLVYRTAAFKHGYTPSEYRDLIHQIHPDDAEDLEGI